MNRKKNRVIIITAAICVIALVAAGIWMLSGRSRHHAEFMKYADFYAAVENTQVKEAEITADAVYFRMRTDNREYYTDNPGYQQFQEFLLLHDVDVTIEDTGADLLYLIMDIFFDIVFIAILGGGVLFLLIRIKKQFPLVKHNKCSFDQIAGMQPVKKDFMQLVDLLKHPETYRKTGVRQPHGILLVGPPGNGKTLFARALAGEAGMNFIATKATDFQSMYMSIGPAKIKSLFKKARRVAPCIVFIDEFDGLGEKRNYAGQAIDKENNRIVTALLNELDGFEQHAAGVLVIAATNSANELDPALIRAGRFDRKYVIPNPDAETRRELLRLYLGERKLHTSIDGAKLADSFQGMSCAQIEAIINEAVLCADARAAAQSGEQRLSGQEKPELVLLDFQNAVRLMRGKNAQEER